MPPDPGVRQETNALPKQETPTQVIKGVSDRDLWEALKAAKGKPVNFYDDNEGRVRSFQMGGRRAAPRPGTRIKLDMRPTPIPPDQLIKAYDEAAEFISTIEKDHPLLANTIINNPQTLHLLPEISMLLGGSSGLTVDVAASLLDAMPNAVGYQSYAHTMFQTPVQQMLWQDVVSQFDSGAKDVVSYMFSGLEERGANRVASLAFAWLNNNPLETQEDQDELLLRMWNWSHAEQQTELHDSGLFGNLDAPQEFVENALEIPVSNLIGWLGSPEESIRRSGLTLGQQAAYQMGLDPDDTAWAVASGATDAIGEVVLDPLNVLAGLGAGSKAAKTIPLSARALEKGRSVFALKSFIPVYGRSFSPLKTRSLTARVTYAFKAKTVDQLFDTFAGTRAGKEAFKLLKEGNRARFLQRFPQLDSLPDSFHEAAKLLDSPEEMSALMKQIHWTDNFADPDEFNKATQALDDAKSALEGAGKHADRRLLELDVVRAEMQVDMMKAKPNRIFVVSDLPSKPNRSLYNFVAAKVAKHDSSVANTVRRWTADLTQGVPSEIDLFDTRKGLKQVRQVLNHYGVDATKTDDLLNEWLALDVGERMQFMLKQVVPAIGDATRNPLLRYNLVEFYNKAGVRAFAAGGGEQRLDEVIDAAGKVTRLPILPSEMQRAFPFDINQIDDVISRFNRSGRLGGALTLGRRGWLSTTQGNRAQLVQRLRSRLGEAAEGLGDDDLYQMAYAWLVPGGIDPRGFASKLLGQPTTKVLKGLDLAFRKAMLGLRPIQWMFKVVLMEEPIRAHVYEMPNMYSKPLGWTQGVMSNHYLNKAEDWATKNIEWVDNVRAQVMAGQKSVEGAITAIRETFGKAADDILGTKEFRSVTQLNRRLASWLHKAALDKKQVSLIPGSTLSRQMRAWKVNKASDIKSRELLAPDFRPVDDIEDIMHKNIYTLFGDQLAVSQSGVVPFNWGVEMSDFARKRYGQAWGGKVIRLVSDPSAKWALRRMAVKAGGGEVPAALGAEAFMETSTWKMMKGNIRRFFPDEATDAARIERYFDEKVEAWAEELLKPVLSQANVNRADFLTELAERRQFKAELNGHPYDIDLSSHGSAQRKLGDLVADQGTFAQTTPFPAEIAAVPFDFRFLDGSGDRNWFRRMIDWNIQTFGEDATQNINRRPFWRAQRRKWLDIYTSMGMPDALAAELASTKASQITNYVMYDISEAPTVIKKLNNVIPFFGATYEVLGTWAYKMPTAVGGYWALGAGAFGRKIDRMMRVFVNTGMATVQEQDGKLTYELQLMREPDTGSPLGDALSQIGYHIRRSPEVAIATLLGAAGVVDKDAALKLSEDGYGMTLGNPLDPFDMGILSFAQFHIGLSPASNWVVAKAAGKLFPAVDVERVESGDTDTTLAELADRLDVDADELARANRSLFSDSAQYKGLFTDDTDPEEVTVPAGSLITIPGSSLFESIVDETLFPYGEVETPAGILRGLVPSMYHHALRGFGLVGTPADAALSGDLDSPPFFGLPMDKQAVNSQLLEAFYYLESTEGIFTDKIFPLQQEYDRLVEAGGGERADEVKAELEALTNEAVKRATDMAGGSMILRGLAGGLFPNTGRALREEMTAIDSYWDSREFAEQMRGNDAAGNKLLSAPLQRVKKVEDIDEFFSQVANWLDDPTGDTSRTWVRENHPTLFAYLQPKTFWGEGGPPPEITNYEDWLDQIRTGQRKPVPLAVAIQRHLHAGVEADYWTDFVAQFGNDPEEAVSRALDNYAAYSQLQDDRYSAHDALYMSDDLHGGEYQKWLDERGTHADDTYESVEKAQDRQRQYMDTLGELLDLDLESNFEASEVRAIRQSIKTTIAKLQELSEEQDSEESGWKNPYELAMRAYWDKVYAGFNETIDPIWEQIGESTDTEKTSLLFENLKLATNDWANKRFTLFGRNDITYPSPLDIRWARKTEDEKRAYALKRSTLPLEWLNMDDVQRILEYAPADAAQFFPTTPEQTEIYTAWTVKKNEINDMAERGEITEGERRDAQAEAEANVITYLQENGRGAEVTYMNLWPVEQLYVLNLLPPELEYLMPEVRFVKESLAAEGKGPRSDVGDRLLLPMYNAIINKASTDLQFGSMLRDLGLTLFDESAYDAILPRLIADDFDDF